MNHILLFNSKGTTPMNIVSMRSTLLLMSIPWFFVEDSNAGEDVMEYLKARESMIRGMLSEPFANEDKLLADQESVRNAAGWIKTVVRPDWLPQDVEAVLHPERRTFFLSPKRNFDVFRLEIAIGSGVIKIFESVGILMIWTDPNIMLGPEPEKQTRVLLRTVLKNYSAVGRLGIKRHLDGNLVTGCLFAKESPNCFPSSWNERVRFWLANGLLIVEVQQATTEAARNAETTAQGSNEDYVRFKEK